MATTKASRPPLTRVLRLISAAAVFALLSLQFRQNVTTMNDQNALPTSVHNKIDDANTQSRFDLLASKLFQKATNPKFGLSEQRKPFVLDETWERGSGGLDDPDRRTIGDLYYNASSVFEFGLGESTLIAAATQVPRYSGVDSDAAWVLNTRKAATALFINTSHFRFYFSDIGETKQWGYPQKPGLAKTQYNYQLTALMAEQEAFDVYMVDGRFRVACACVSFLHAIKHGANLETVRVLIHDNDKQNRGYGVFRRVAVAVVKNEKLWVYKLKTNRPDIEKELYDLWNNTKRILF